MITAKACTCSYKKEDCKHCKINHIIILGDDFQCKTARTEDVITDLMWHNKHVDINVDKRSLYLKLSHGDVLES